MSELDDDPNKTAEELGLVVRLPQGDELLLDIDSPDDSKHYAAMMEGLAQLSTGPRMLYEAKRLPSRQAGHAHVYMRTEFLKDYDEGSREKAVLRIALQACLGSDRKRELLSLLRILFRMDRSPTVLFEKPGAEEAVPENDPCAAAYRTRSCP